MRIKKKGTVKRNTTASFDSQDTGSQPKNSHKRLFFHHNKEQLQLGTNKSTKEITKQDDLKKTHFNQQANLE